MPYAHRLLILVAAELAVRFILSQYSSLTMIDKSEIRRQRHGLGWIKRPKTLRCRWCKTKMKVAPRGRLPSFCCQSCRQRDYERRKWSRPSPQELLARNIADARVRSFIRREIFAVLLKLGVAKEAELPPLPSPRRRILH